MSLSTDVTCPWVLKLTTLLKKIDAIKVKTISEKNRTKLYEFLVRLSGWHALKHPNFHGMQLCKISITKQPIPKENRCLIWFEIIINESTNLSLQMESVELFYKVFGKHVVEILSDCTIIEGKEQYHVPVMIDFSLND